MREIKFRGWDATGQKGWVYGDLMHTKGISKDSDKDLYDRVMVGGYEVVPESVGQCTGFRANSRRYIYEGDIFNCRHVSIDKIDVVQRRYVYFNSGCFLAGLCNGKNIDARPVYEFDYIRFIGTIYEQSKK